MALGPEDTTVRSVGFIGAGYLIYLTQAGGPAVCSDVRWIGCGLGIDYIVDCIAARMTFAVFTSHTRWGRGDGPVAAAVATSENRR